MSLNLLNNTLNDEEKGEILFPSFLHFFPSIKKDRAKKRKRENVWKGETRRLRRRILSTNQRDLCTVITNQTTARKTRSPFGCSAARNSYSDLCLCIKLPRAKYLLDKRNLSLKFIPHRFSLIPKFVSFLELGIYRIFSHRYLQSIPSFQR